MKAVNRTGFYIAHGVEIRHFMLSGLFNYARQNGEAVIIMKKDVGSAFLKDYTAAAHVIYLPDNLGTRKRHPMEGLVSMVRAARLRLKKIGNFHHYSESARPHFFKDFLLGNKISFNFFSIFSLPFLKQHYTDPALVSFFSKQQLQVLFIVDYNDPFQLRVAYSASKAGADIRVIINTLKSFYINDFIPFKVNRLYTWNEKQNELFKKSNVHQPVSSFQASGNPFHNFIFAAPDLSVIAGELKELENKPFIIYSLIFEKVFGGEYEIVALINSFLNENFKTNCPKIVLRRNPFEEMNNHADRFKELNNVIIAPHSWERKADKEWSIQSYKGEMEWKFLLANAAMLINITSMAAVESVLSGTPVINIGFNGQGLEEPTLKRFSNAPFLEDILVSDFVQLALTFPDFKAVFFEFYHAKEKIKKEQIMHSMHLSVTNNLAIQQMAAE